MNGIHKLRISMSRDVYLGKTCQFLQFEPQGLLISGRYRLVGSSGDTALCTEEAIGLITVAVDGFVCQQRYGLIGDGSYLLIR